MCVCVIVSVSAERERERDKIKIEKEIERVLLCTRTRLLRDCAALLMRAVLLLLMQHSLLDAAQ